MHNIYNVFILLVDVAVGVAQSAMDPGEKMVRPVDAVEVRDSKLHGQGLFTTRSVKAGAS